jgi:mannose-6-phosphate isomerase-like protein (cupin superfamily)
MKVVSMFLKSGLGSGHMDVVNLDQVEPFITKDGSQIRELLAYRNSSIVNQSLAEATVPPHGSTDEHYHAKTEEIYFILEGEGRMRIETETQEVRVGDAIAIPPGKKHKLWNTGSAPLRLLCCCAPCYEHLDTIITESEEPSK